ncbi:hypothetical protein GE118_03580 [Mycoplasma sp. NEAQ87857]|uniref:Mbov_0401 family ICE element transposase-like protein n=1 Tax=Mycoplasma sp. NEAQ87857 TaxID=2683967 RepID=UPI001317BB92|nr:hypothetical protein [Mycoplasma sp. NEAQ87857]QGZ97244.1 hypothetical protein GE118_00300 [Mycoplasma sp. NEAQ87857]QGZ97863.1 hypothetical protein GE118_03580 [Mycoplasma sp. NEAQ87857]
MLYQADIIVYYFDELEERFRTITRLIEHPEWKVFRRVKRKFITEKGVKYFNLTRYKVYDKELGKYRTFTYYHHEYLKELKTSKFSLELKDIAIKNYLSGNKITNLTSKNYPSKQLIYAWVNNETKSNPEIQFNNDKQWNFINNLCDYSNNVLSKHKYLYVEIDDAFFETQLNRASVSKRNRMLRFYLEKDPSTKRVKYKNELFFLEDSNTPSKVSINFLVNKINHIKDTLYNKGLKVVVKGDGAKWIQKLANSKGYIPVLDKFHFMKLAFETFGATKKKNKENSIFYEKEYFYNQTNLYQNIKQSINNNNINGFKQVLDFIKNDVIKKLETKLTNKVKKFLNYVKNNWNGIFNLVVAEVDVKSSSESFVNNSLKSLIHKRSSRYNIVSIVKKIMLLGPKDVGKYICW